MKSTDVPEIEEVVRSVNIRLDAISRAITQTLGIQQLHTTLLRNLLETIATPMDGAESDLSQTLEAILGVLNGQVDILARLELSISRDRADRAG